MRSDEHRISSVLPKRDGPLFVGDRRSVAAFVRQLPEPNSDLLALFVDTDLRLLEAVTVGTWTTFRADEIVRVAASVRAAGIILAHVGPEGATDWNAARTACSAVEEACRETDAVLLDCLLVSDGEVNSLTGLNSRPRPQERLADNPWSRRHA